ncbi:MAG: SOS response-associated peptidase [Acidimicrobiales bacterium]|nr:SOS response-associated peptidase [Acidimicrobiales bacterium]
MNLMKLFDIPDPPSTESSPSWNVAPGQDVLIVVESEKRNRIEKANWGLVPAWAKDIKTLNRPINARSETLSEKPFFRNLIKSKRCIVPADGFYEWSKIPEASDKSQELKNKASVKSSKVPHYINRSNGDLLALAGLWDFWRDKNSEIELTTFTIITTAANNFMKPIHDRMPVIVDPSLWQMWLGESQLPSDALAEIFNPPPDAILSTYIVSTKVNSPTNNGEELITPIVN